MSAVVLHGVRKCFGGNEVLRGVDLEVRSGERHALIGPNGAGKSTLFNIVSGRMRASSGSVTVDGASILGLPARAIARMGIGRSFQIINVFPRLSVLENVRSAVVCRCGLQWNCWSRLQSLRIPNERAVALLEEFGLTSVRDTPAGLLAYGRQRELELCLTLASDPRVLLLDEPCAGLNAEDTSRAVALIERVSAGRTLLIVEHDMGVVFRLAHRVSVLHHGRVLVTGSAAEVQGNEEVRDAYLGRRRDAVAG